MKTKFLTLLVVIFSLSIGQAEGGNEGTGGGDPTAFEFASRASQVSLFINQNPTFSSGVDLDRMNNWVVSLFDSLTDDVEESLIEVVEDRPTDSNGTAKAAVFNRNNLKLKLHFATWQMLNEQQKIQLVAMELYGFAGVSKDRYWRARLLGPEVAKIESGYINKLEACVEASEKFNNEMKSLKENFLTCTASDKVSGRYEQAVKQTKIFAKKVIEKCHAPGVSMLQRLSTDSLAAHTSLLQTKRCR